jgi:hypothetical protein
LITKPIERWPSINCELWLKKGPNDSAFWPPDFTIESVVFPLAKHRFSSAWPLRIAERRSMPANGSSIN